MKKTRISRIASEMQKETSVIINQDLKDTRIAPITSITEIDLKDDLQSAEIFVSVLGDKKDKEETMAGLTSSIGYIKKLLGTRMSLRHIPDLRCTLDEHLEKVNKLDKLIDDVIKKDNEAIDARENK